MAQQTVEAINQLRPDLVFLDVQMPRRDGFEVLARIPPGCGTTDRVRHGL